MVWLNKNKYKVTVFHLPYPLYSPELNPNERFNRDLKTHFHSGSIVKNEKEFKNKIVSCMLSMKKIHFVSLITLKDVEYAA